MGACLGGMFNKRGRYAPKTFFDKYTVCGKTECGSFGSMSRCFVTKTRSMRALRMINTMRTDESSVTRLIRKEKIHKRLKHKNVVRFYESFSEDMCRYQVFEMLNAKELFEGICGKDQYSRADARTYIRDILCAVEYCHQKHIILRNLIPECFVLPIVNAPVKLLDIGSATVTRFGRKQWYGEVSDAFYEAPEIIRKEPYGKPADVWACGVILYNLFSGIHPFVATDVDELRAQIKNDDYYFPTIEWRGMTYLGFNLINRMLVNNRNERLTASDALQHQFFKYIDDATIEMRLDTLVRLRALYESRIGRRNRNENAANSPQIVTISYSLQANEGRTVTVRNRSEPCTSSSIANRSIVTEMARRPRSSSLCDAVIEAPIHNPTEPCSSSDANRASTIEFARRPRSSSLCDVVIEAPIHNPTEPCSSSDANRTSTTELARRPRSSSLCEAVVEAPVRNQPGPCSSSSNESQVTVIELTRQPPSSHMCGVVVDTPVSNQPEPSTSSSNTDRAAITEMTRRPPSSHLCDVVVECDDAIFPLSDDETPKTDF